MKQFKYFLLVSICGMLVALPLKAQAMATKCGPSLNLAHLQHTEPKGRLQYAGAPQTAHILALGKKASPMLIACLSNETRTRQPIEDYWPATTVDDIAFLYSCDLFTDSTWQHSTSEGVIIWKTLEIESPDSPASASWSELVKKHGRKSIQNAWSKRWTEVEQSVFWDDKEQCFKIAPQTKK
jgi:hypothetical protein